jgi:hypothetical protein
MRMKYEFTAVNVETFASGTTGVFLGSTEDEDEPGTAADQVLIYRSSEPGEEVVGIDGVYLEWNDQGNSCWGNLEEVRLHRDQLYLRFASPLKPVPTNVPLTRDLVEALEDVDELVAHFNLDTSRFQAVRKVLLDDIFAGCSCFRDLSGRRVVR